MINKTLLAVVVFFGFSSVTFARPGAPEIQCMAVPALMQAFLRTHVTNPTASSDLNTKIASQFVKRVDPSKTILLQSDVDNIQPSVIRFMENQRDPDCSDIDAVKALLITRSQDQLTYAKAVLVDNYKLVETAEIVLDPEKRQFPKTAAEAKDRQLTQIHFQISNYLMTDMKLPETRKQLVHRYELAVKRMQELSSSDLYDYLVNAMALALDPHSSYLSPEAMEDFQINMRLSLEGIGASLSPEDGYTVIQELIPGGAAARSKLLQPKDKIIAVGQNADGTREHVLDLDLRDVVRKIRGKAGTTVRLSILRTGKEAERFNINLVRSKVNLEDDAAKIEYYDRKVDGKIKKFARLELPSFYGDNTLQERSCSKDVAKLLEAAKKKKIDGLILDLSQNGGGRLEEAVRIAGLFIRKGNIVATKDSRKEVQTLDDTDAKVQYSGPLVVLISRLSASASEIVAGALQDYKRAVIFGADHTFGKGSVQAVLDLQNNFGAIKVTTGIFYIPGGNSTQHRGVVSDVTVPNIYSTDDLGEKYLDYSLKPDAIASFLSGFQDRYPMLPK
jgi:carboxyl-terminal processing protease